MAARALGAPAMDLEIGIALPCIPLPGDAYCFCAFYTSSPLQKQNLECLLYAYRVYDDAQDAQAS